MPPPERIADQFEQHRPHLRGVAYRMLGSVSEAEDAVQEAWIRLSRTAADEISNLRAWLTTVVGRVCLDMLRTRTARREDPLDTHVPDPIVTRLRTREDAGPEADAVLADSVGLALLVVLDRLDPAERLAFVLHDVFGLSFDEIAPIVDRSVVATRQLASRARRRVQGEVPTPDADLRGQRRVVDAFLAAARDGDLEGLLAVLDPAVVLRADAGPLTGMSRIVRGARGVAEQAALFSKGSLEVEIVLVNSGIGLVSRRPDGRVFSLLAFTVAGGRIAAIDILADPERLERIESSLA